MVPSLSVFNVAKLAQQRKTMLEIQSTEWSHSKVTKWDGVGMNRIMDLRGNTHCKWTAYFDSYIPQDTES